MTLKPFLLILSLLIFSLPSLAQIKILTGWVIDTTGKTPLGDAVVSVLRAQDSTLYKHSRTTPDGSFRISNLDPGKYIFFVSYAGYEDLNKTFDLSNASTDSVSVGQLGMLSKTKLLTEVTVTGKISIIMMKGDTTEFLTENMKMEPNAMVEDMIRRLPGMRVDKDGGITAQGQKVQKILVDGNEFFSDNPTIVTRNLYADMVAKVQLYDKKSRQSAFTGVDDGMSSKTIDIKLKKNRKNGYFGKVEAGSDGQKLHEEQVMYNNFKDARKLAVYGISGNNGVVGLGMADKNEFATGDNSTGNEGLDSWNGNYDGKGIPAILSGGIHYNNNWDPLKQMANGNYKIANLDVSGKNNTLSQINLPLSVQFVRSAETFKDHSIRNNLRGEYDIQPSGSSTVEITVDGSINHKDVHNYYTSMATRPDSTLLNNSTRTINTNGDFDHFNSTGLWLKKFERPGKTLSFSVKETESTARYSGFLFSTNNFYDTANVLESASTINQFKKNENRSCNIDSKLVLTEPISNEAIISANYGVFIDKSISDISSYNRSSSGAFDEADSSGSIRYDVKQLIHKTGMGLNYKKDNLLFNVSADLGINRLSQDNGNAGKTLQREFLNWYPAAKLRYAFSQQTILSISYHGSSTSPTATQLNPLHINDDPLNIYAGNPYLSPSFSNNWDLLYRNYKVATNTTFLINSSYSLTTDPICLNTQIDSAGKGTYTYVNAPGNSISNYSSYILYGIRPGKFISAVSFDGGANRSAYINFSNGSRNTTVANAYNAGFGLSSFKLKKYDFSLNIKTSYNVIASSLQKEYSNNYWSSVVNMSIDIYAIGKFQLHNDLVDNFQQKSKTFSRNFNQLIWNAWIGRKFFSKGNLLVKLSANDLLNQNQGFIRNVTNNMITQNNYNTIARYFMLTAVFNFIKQKAN